MKFLKRKCNKTNIYELKMLHYIDFYDRLLTEFTSSFVFFHL